MLAPAVNISTAASPVPRSSPTDTGVTHMVGMSLTGPSGRLLTEDDAIINLDDWIARYGGGSTANARLSYSVDYDWIDRYFRRGGNKLFYSRVVGPSPVKATINLAGTGTTLIVTADEYGSYFNAFKIKVIQGPIGGSGYRVVQLMENDGTTVIDQTDEFNDRTAVSGVQLGADDNVPVTITLGGGSGLPTVAAATALSSGTDDRASITQTQVDTALTYLSIDNGPGQVVSPNWQTNTAHDSLDAHAAANNRFAVPDPVDTTTKSTLVSAGSHRKATTNGSYGALYAPWYTVPPLATGGSDRTVPPSALVCAKFAAVDPVFTPSQAPAGQWGTDEDATGVRATFARVPAGASDADDLADAAVNLIVVRNGVVTIYDILTGADDDDEFQQVGVARWRMQTVALAGSQADSEIFARINKNTLTAWKTAVDAILLRQYNNGQLFGDLDDDRPETAFNTDVDTPNTPTTINAGQMNMNIAARPVKGGRILNISIAAVPITSAVA
jgi:hypothetical protein